MPIISTYSLAPYSGKWDTDDLLHLLRRTLFGIGHKELNFFRHKSLDQCLKVLLTPSLAPPAPRQEDPDIKDPLVPIGDTWVDAPYENDLIDTKRGEALRSWWVSHIINRDYSVTQKMILFWHNHFPIEMDLVKDARYSYRYYSLLCQYSLGNFKKFIKAGAINPAMLVYLNGNSNNKVAPNENFSRELMELFTLGKSADVKYTEGDVKAAARILTGWKDDKITIQSDFDPSLHDTGDKAFSSFFDHKIILGKPGEAGAHELDELVDMIFQKEAVARFTCRNLYRWFVCAHIDDQVELQIITPLAAVLIAADFEIIPVLRTLLGSAHFFDKVFRGCIEKSPVDFLVGVIQQFGVVYPGDPSRNLLCSVIIHDFMSGLSMNISNPPSVSGWPAYYQAPKYHQWWINPSSLSVRMELVNSLNSEEGMRCNGPDIKFDLPDFVNQFRDVHDIDALIDSSLELLLAVKVSANVKEKLKAILLSGQESPHYWADAWSKYKADPNEENKSIVENRVRMFYKSITNMIQYQMT